MKLGERLRISFPLWMLLLAACGDDPTIVTTPPAGSPTPSPSPSGSPTDTATPRPANHRPSATFGAITVEETRVLIPVTPTDEDGDLVDLRILYSYDGYIFRPCTRANGSDNTLQVTPDTTVTYLWKVQEDVTGEKDVILRVVPSDGTQDGDFDQTGPVTVVGAEVGENGEVEIPGLEEVGGWLDPVFGDSTSVTVDLNADGDRNNQEEEFLLILVNGGDEAGSYFLGEEGDIGEETPTPDETPAATPTPDASRPVQPKTWAGGLQAPRPLTHPVVPDPAARTSPMEVGVTQREFRVLSHLDNGTYKTVLGILAATADGVDIYIDQDIPVDWDYDCDGVINPDAGDEYDRLGRNAYGFDTCDLQSVGDVFSLNILANLRGLFGEESDVNDNGAVTVLLTPVLNTLNETNDDDSDDGQVVEVLANPEVDLAENDPEDNPGSNEQEIFYLPAPDPAGFFNPEAGGGGEQAIQSYVTLTMAANLARATQSLISYNQHVLVSGGDPEDDWLDEGLGTLAADLTGFGGKVYGDLFGYLAVPHLVPIQTATITSEADAAPAYLLTRYLVDRFGTDVLLQLMTNGLTGVDNIEGAVKSVSGPDTFEELMLDYATTLLLATYTNTDGEPLIDPDLVPPFLSATTIPATGSSAYPGAEGYQQGVNVHGDNYQRSRDGASLITEAIYRLSGTDWRHYAPGIPYAGYLQGGFAFTAVRVGGLIEASSSLTIASKADLSARLIRLPDVSAGGRTFITEQVYGARSTASMRMDARDDGWASVALGEVDPSEPLTLLDTGLPVSVADTDLYAVDLTGWAPGPVTVEAFVVRRVDKSGEAELGQVFVALAPEGDVPDAEEIDGSFTCGGLTVNVDYPNAWLEYLYYQTVLTSTVAPTDYEEASLGSSRCDFDTDGVGDNEEDRPASLVDQIQTWQDEALGGTSSLADSDFYPYDTTYPHFVSGDVLDEDDEPYTNALLGVNTQRAETGEEAFLRVDVPAGTAGARYLVIVGGEGSTGPYELTVKVTAVE